MKKIKYFMMVLLLVLLSCSKKNENPVVNQEQITVVRNFMDNVYDVLGYSFELSKAVSVLDTKQVPDIIPTRIQNPDGSVLGAQFSVGGNNPYGSHKLGAFATLQEAADFYDSVATIDETSWESLSDTLAPFQVYAFKTYKENYVKFMITSVTIIDGPTPQDSYVDIDLKYVIQRDGCQKLQVSQFPDIANA